MNEKTEIECSVIERVTKAIFDEMDIADGLDGTVAERYARRAIEAMREPTGDMIDEGAIKRHSGMSDVKEIYQAMIDAALKEHSVRDRS